MSIQEQKPRPSGGRIRWIYLFWLLVPVLLWWALRDIRLVEIWATIRLLKPWQLFVLALVNAGIILLNGGRWWLILRTQGNPVPYISVAGYRLISFGISYFTPGPQFGGEPAQVYYLQKRHSLPTTPALAAVSLDKILELLANFAFLLLGLVAALSSGLFVNQRPGQALVWMATPFALLLVYTVALWRGRSPLAGLLSSLPGSHPMLVRVRMAVAQAERQIASYCLARPGAVILASFLSLFIWLVMGVEYWLALRFLGVALSPAQTIVAMTLARIAFLFPLPGGLGVLEASQVLAMQALGFNPALGISASLLMRARDVVMGGTGLLISAWLARRDKAVRAQPISKVIIASEE